jgi:hypothetical protein
MEKETNMLKRLDLQYLTSIVNRDLGILLDNSIGISQKKQTVENLYNFCITEKPVMKPEFIQEILISFNKNLIKIAFFDPIEKCREYCLKILI